MNKIIKYQVHLIKNDLIIQKKYSHIDTDQFNSSYTQL